MFWSWFKNYLPRGLYGRAALILVLPVLLLQLLVSIVFIQRHFDGVTRAMTSALTIELRYLRDVIDQAPDKAAAMAMANDVGTALEVEIKLPAGPAPMTDLIAFDDLTGSVVFETMREGVPNITRISLTDRARVRLWIPTQFGVAEMSFSRGRVSASNPHQLLVIMVILGAIMTTIAYFFLRNQLRPIKRMADAAADYGKGRITPFSPGGAVEVRAAGMAFLDMRNRIERQTQSRTMMLSGVSHDLRTPLTRLRLGLSMIDHDDKSALLRDVDDMQGLLDSFLEFARDDALDELMLCSPGEIAMSAVADAARNGAQISLGPITGPDVQASLRPKAVRRALDNLIGNALRYGDLAEVCLDVTDRTIRYSVEDNGPGIPAASREAAMSPFVRLDPARNQNKGTGVGLGLSIVADVARSHGGLLRLSDSDSFGGLKAELVLAR